MPSHRSFEVKLYHLSDNKVKKVTRAHRSIKSNTFIECVESYIKFVLNSLSVFNDSTTTYMVLVNPLVVFFSFPQTG